MAINDAKFHYLLAVLGVPAEEVAISQKAMLDVLARHDIGVQPIVNERLDDSETCSLRSVIHLDIDADKLYAMNHDLDLLMVERLPEAHPWAYVAMFERGLS